MRSIYCWANMELDRIDMTPQSAFLFSAPRRAPPKGAATAAKPGRERVQSHRLLVSQASALLSRAPPTLLEESKSVRSQRDKS